jgi:hypothetical protein
MKRERQFKGYYKLMKAIGKHDIQEFKADKGTRKLRVRKLNQWNGKITFAELVVVDLSEDEILALRDVEE